MLFRAWPVAFRIAETPRASRLPCPARSASSPFLSDWTPPIGWEGGPVHIRVRCAHSPGVGETTPGFIRTAIRISDDQINFNIHLTIHLNHVCGVAGLVPATLLFWRGTVLPAITSQTASLPGLTRQSIFFAQKKRDPRLKPAGDAVDAARPCLQVRVASPHRRSFPVVPFPSIGRARPFTMEGGARMLPVLTARCRHRFSLSPRGVLPSPAIAGERASVRSRRTAKCSEARPSPLVPAFSPFFRNSCRG